MLLLAALAAALGLAVPVSAQPLAPGEKAMDVRLAAETSVPEAGRVVTLALLMEPRPGWHGYWQNPGDAGRAPSIAWQLPPGVTAGPLRYPVPQRLEVGGLVNYVYEGRYALLADLRLPPGLPFGAQLPVRATFDYLVCTDEVCVPESATVSLDLTVGVGRLTRRAEFDLYREAMAEPLASRGRFERRGGIVRLAIPLPAAVPLPNPYFFPLTDGALDYSAPQSVSRRGDLLIVETRAGRGPPPPASLPPSDGSSNRPARLRAMAVTSRNRNRITRGSWSWNAQPTVAPPARTASRTAPSARQARTAPAV